MSDFDLELQAAQEEAARSRRTAKRTMLGLALLSIVLIGAVAIAAWLAANNADLAAENASFGVQQQDEKKEIAKEASQALCGQGDKQIYDRDLCIKWAEAAQEPAVTVETAPALPGTPTQADLVNAFREYCADGNCKGRDGQPPTPDDIAASFVAFCVDGRCVGKTGATGNEGKPGADAEPVGPTMEMVLTAVTQVCSTGLCTGPAGTDGAPGPGPSSEMVLAAVQQVCAEGFCQGPKGDTGATGATGQSPSSITFTDKTGTKYTCTPDPPGSSTYTCASDGVLTP